MANIRYDLPIGQYKRIAIPTVEGYVFIVLHEIMYCKAAVNYTHFRLSGDRTIVSSYTLKYFHGLLDDLGFYRVHKSYLVNFSHLASYSRKGFAVLSDGTEIDVSRTYKNDFLEKLKGSFVI